MEGGGNGYRMSVWFWLREHIGAVRSVTAGPSVMTGW